MNENNTLREKIVELFDDEMDTNDIVQELYTAPDNYNNCDETSGQTVFTESELKAEVELALLWMREQDDRCSECGRKLNDENYKWEQNLCTNDPYPIYETIATGYTCSCGFKERF